MKKLSIILIGLFVVINLSIGSIAGFTLFADSDAKADNVTESVSSPRSARDEQTSPDSYDPSNIFYLCSPNNYYKKKLKRETTIHFLKGVPYNSDGSDENLNKCELVNGAPTPFYYPAPGKRPTKLKYNQSFTGNPFISLVLNSYADASKTVVVTLGIDTNNNYDEHSLRLVEK